MNFEAQLLVPSWGLAAANIGVGLLGLFSEASGTVGVLLADGLAIGEVLGTVNDEDKCADKRAIDTQVREDAGGVHPIEGVDLGLGRHQGGDVFVSRLMIS